MTEHNKAYIKGLESFQDTLQELMNEWLNDSSFDQTKRELAIEHSDKIIPLITSQIQDLGGYNFQPDVANPLKLHHEIECLYNLIQPILITENNNKFSECLGMLDSLINE